jgi:hypothetical protein
MDMKRRAPSRREIVEPADESSIEEEAAGARSFRRPQPLPRVPLCCRRLVAAIATATKGRSDRLDSTMAPTIAQSLARVAELPWGDARFGD